MTRVGNPVLSAVRRSLGRHERSPVARVPAMPPPRAASDQPAELDRLFEEIGALSGVTRRLRADDVASHLARLVSEERVGRAALSGTAGLEALDLRAELERLGVRVVDGSAHKNELARCDLGITEVDVALPETGTLGLFSSSSQARAVSLLPRVHLAIMTPKALVADLHAVFARARREHYLVFITGPSRTADIELTVTLGVHGPRRLVVWCIVEP
jgi:L-lactate dehydrogenase complex protein LldG